MGITFTNGMSIIPNGNNGGGTETNAGEYYLLTGAGGYNPGLNQGKIVFPKHSVQLGIADPNLILSEASLYINLTDSNSEDRTTILTSMFTNSGTIRFSQNANHIEFSFTPDTFRMYQDVGVDTSVYWDIVPFPPNGTLSVVSTSGTAFDESDPITITIDI
jgi:hypothetical protein